MVTRPLPVHKNWLLDIKIAKFYIIPNFIELVGGVGVKALLCSFRKFQKASSCLSVRME